MISLPQLRRFFLTMSLAVMLATAITFGFGSANSWAATSVTQLISQPQAQIATMNRVEAITKNIEGKAQEANSKMTGDPKTQAANKEAKRFKGKTLEGMDNSIVNPNYQPGGKTKQAEKQASEGTEDMKTEASEAMDSYSKK